MIRKIYETVDKIAKITNVCAHCCVSHVSVPTLDGECWHLVSPLQERVGKALEDNNRLKLHVSRVSDSAAHFESLSYDDTPFGRMSLTTRMSVHPALVRGLEREHSALCFLRHELSDLT